MRTRSICIVLVFCLLLSIPAFAAGDSYSMETSEAGIAFIKYYEGFRSTPYPDGDGYAIGYGTHCDLSQYPDGITVEQADALLRERLAVMETAVNDMARSFGITLTQNQFDALLSLTYNLGTSWMTKEYRLYNMLASGIQYYSAYEVVNTFGRYCHYKTEINEALARRRLAEAKMFLYSDYRTGSTLNYVYEISDDPDAESDITFKAEGGMTACTFWDIDYTQWFYQYISPLSFLGVISGYGDGSFRPDALVTNGEALKLILVSAGYGEQAPTGEHWASGYLSLAEELGFLEAGSITDLDGYMDRSQCAELSAMASGLPADGSASPFSDTDSAYVAALYSAGIVTGSYDESGTLVYKPGEYLKRSELCAVVWRLCNY